MCSSLQVKLRLNGVRVNAPHQITFKKKDYDFFTSIFLSCSMPEEKDYSENLHKSAKALTFENAKNLRRNETPAEKILWQYLRNRQLNGMKFRRQHPIDKYVLDFYCHERKLAIELDGGIHDEKMNKLYDQARTTDLNDEGIQVIRFRNEEVLNNVTAVIKRIIESIAG
jgi:very-short-patch-repair endonuclease